MNHPKIGEAQDTSAILLDTLKAAAFMTVLYFVFDALARLLLQ